MALDDDIRVLSGVGLFEGFTHEQLRLMAFGAERISLEAGQKLYAEGAPADCAFVVVEGQVELYRQRGETRQTLSVREAGAILGELALIAESERLTSADARTDIRVIRLNRSMFRRILEEFPDTAIKLQRRITADLHSMLRNIGDLATRLGG